MQGIHLIRHAVYRTVQQGGQFVLLGSGHADGDFRAMAAVCQPLIPMFGLDRVEPCHIRRCRLCCQAYLEQQGTAPKPSSAGTAVATRRGLMPGQLDAQQIADETALCLGSNLSQGVSPSWDQCAHCVGTGRLQGPLRGAADDHVQRQPGSPDLRRGGHRPGALHVRAVRPHPAHCHEVREGGHGWVRASTTAIRNQAALQAAALCTLLGRGMSSYRTSVQRLDPVPKV